jgi:hypothetical protein
MSTSTFRTCIIATAIERALRSVVPGGVDLYDEFHFNRRIRPADDSVFGSDEIFLDRSRSQQLSFLPISILSGLLDQLLALS